MRAVAERRFPVILIILVALVGIAVSVAIGRVIAADAGETATSWIIEAGAGKSIIPARAVGRQTGGRSLF